MKLCLLILGESQIDQSVYQFRQAGAYDMARWMAKVIYSFKIYLLRERFHLTRHRTVFCLFVSHVYVKSWINCPITCDAPINDLQLLKNIKRYSTVSKLVLLQSWQSFKTTFRMLDPNWRHFFRFPAVCQRTCHATFSTVCVKHNPEVQWSVRSDSRQVTWSTHSRVEWPC